MSRTRRAVFAALFGALIAGCGSPNVPTLPDEPVRRGGNSGTGDAPAGIPEPGPATNRVKTGSGFTPVRDGDRLQDSLVIEAPVLEGRAASFRVRNESGVELPDLMLAVIFSVPRSDGAPRIAITTVEAPLGPSETRSVTATLRAGGQAVPTAFRVVTGVPEILAARQGDLAGTNFLGGTLECVELSADLIADPPSVAVGLAPTELVGSEDLPPLEAQLLIVRHGNLVWSGAWIRLPTGDPEGSNVRRIHWNLGSAPHVAGATLYLRVRDRR